MFSSTPSPVRSDQDEYSYCGSEVSSGSHVVLDAIQLETERRKSRLKNLKKKKHSKHSKSRDTEDHKKNAGASIGFNNEQDAPKSIMIVSTLKESLANSNVSKEIGSVRSKRRMLKRRMDFLRKDAQNSNSTVPVERPTSPSSHSTRSTLSPNKFDVTFNHVIIREYPMVPGDNPSVIRGAPLSIGWDHITEVSFDIDFYEDDREDQRRSQTEMRVPLSTRTQILQDLGYKLNEIREATKQAGLTKRQRRRTLEMLHTHKIEEKVESFKRLFKSPFKSRQRRKHERHLSVYRYASDSGIDANSDSEMDRLVSEDHHSAPSSERNLDDDENHSEPKSKKEKYDSSLNTTKRSGNLSLSKTSKDNKEFFGDDVDSSLTTNKKTIMHGKKDYSDDIDSSRRRSKVFDLTPESITNQLSDTVLTTTTSGTETTSSSESKLANSIENDESFMLKCFESCTPKGKRQVKFLFHDDDDDNSETSVIYEPLFCLPACGCFLTLLKQGRLYN